VELFRIYGVKIVALGGIDDVLQGMQTHTLDLEVQCKGCAALQDFPAKNADNQVKIAALGCCRPCELTHQI